VGGPVGVSGSVSWVVSMGLSEGVWGVNGFVCIRQIISNLSEPIVEQGTI
jgi:hypothetical protein